MWFTEEELDHAKLNTVVKVEGVTPLSLIDARTESQSKRKPTRSRPRKGLAPRKKTKCQDEMDFTDTGS
jgi:hypothetical protein